MKMNNFKKIVWIVSVGSQLLVAAPLFQISGDVLSGAFYTTNQNERFESVANISVDAMISPSIITGISFNLGQPDSAMGFVDDSIVASPYIQYVSRDHWQATLGVVPVPFGQAIAAATNHAQKMSVFLMNDLLTAYLAGGNLTTVDSNGIRFDSLASNTQSLQIAVFNGLHTNNNNDEDQLSASGYYSNSDVIPNVAVGVGMLYSKTDITRGMYAYLMDASTTVYGIELNAYVAWLTADDGHDTTLDDVFAYMVSAHQTRPDMVGLTDVTLGIRLSAWMPNDYNGDGVGLSDGLATVPLSFDVPDVDMFRFDLSTDIPIDSSIQWSNHVIMDMYGNTSSDLTAMVMSYVTVSF